MRQGYENAVRKDNFQQQQQQKLSSSKQSNSLDHDDDDEIDRHNSLSNDEQRTMTNISENENTTNQTKIGHDSYSQILNVSTTTSITKTNTPKWRRQSNAIVNKSPIIIRSKSDLDIKEQLNDINVQL